MSEWQTRENWDRRSDPRENERTGFARGFVDGFVVSLLGSYYRVELQYLFVPRRRSFRSVTRKVVCRLSSGFFRFPGKDKVEGGCCRKQRYHTGKHYDFFLFGHKNIPPFIISPRNNPRA